MPMLEAKSKTKPKVGPLKNKDGSMTGDSEAMSKILNEYFASTFTVEKSQYISAPSKKALNGKVIKLETVEINENKIVNSIKKLQDKKAAGVDEFNSTFIKLCIRGITEPLVVFQESLNVGVVPEDWRVANVVALHKKGSRSEPSNYRPVSLTSQVGKMLERIIKESLVKYLESNNLIYNSQHGFRQKRSCLTNLLEYLQLLADRVDEEVPTDIVYLHFSKAFDKVPKCKQ
jgi:hypothetical protein